ncbi:amidohydrolase [Neomegalonema sp.]|uniref:amidohydrolase n=1 Tax=Neomegalonema sp. TaxID=2039713 RepID=UPI00261A9D62|nr:amidohydrolase [Neomegalonema sp.]MDD2867197.1 amidohydrolase [Neomegalonema sp.]
MNASPPLSNEVLQIAEEMRAWRRDLHRHPELGYQETRTSARVAGLLREFGFDAVETGLGGTGVVGVLHGAGGPAADESGRILLRADMDALPMLEESGVEHASTRPGVMHACGHDGHTTMLLGAAKLLAASRNFKGTVHFVFQPAEEGGAGAAAMIRDGLFERFPAHRVFGMHNWPNAPVGAFFTRVGPLLAAADEFSIKVHGKGGHAAQPHQGRDPIPGAAAIVLALQTVVSRTVDPLQPAVLSVTQFHAGTAFNVISELAELRGTVRSFDEETHERIYAEMTRIVRDTAAAHGLTAAIERKSSGYYPPTVNEAEATRFALGVAREVAETVVGDVTPTMGAEDFSFMAQARPGCFMLMGIGPGAPLHDPRYDFNDEAAPWGTAYWVRLVEQALPR